MNKKFYLAGALALAMSMATPQFAFAEVAQTWHQQTVVSTAKFTKVLAGSTQAHIVNNGVDYTIWSYKGNKYAFVKGFTKDAEDVTIVNKVNLGLVFDNEDVDVIGFDNKDGLWTANEKIKTITIKNSQIEVIPAGLFENFTALTTVYTGSDIEEIGAGAFAGCKNLSAFGASTSTKAGECRIQSSYGKIGDAAFEGTAFSKIYVTASAVNVEFGKVNPWKDCTGVTSIVNNAPTYYTVSDNMLIHQGKVITYALGAAKAEAVSIPGTKESPISVLSYAFANNANPIETLTVGEWVSPYADAFVNTNATNVVVKGKILDMDDLKSALSSRVNSETLKYDPVPNAHVTSLTIEDLQLSTNKSFVAEQLSALTALTSLTIESKGESKCILPKADVGNGVEGASVPESLTSLTLKNISTQAALCHGQSLDELKLINSSAVTLITDKALATGKDAHLSVELDNSTIGKWVGCNLISSVDLKNISSTKNTVFTGCANLSSATWDEKLTTIAANTFSGTALTAVDLNKVTTIGASAFTGTPLESVDLEGVTSLGAKAFQNCAQLVSATNCNVANIPANLFDGCELLSEIELLNLESIGADALKGCHTLETVTIAGQPAETGETPKPAVQVELPVADGKPFFAECDALTTLNLKDVKIFFGSDDAEKATKKYPIYSLSSAATESALVTLNLDNVSYCAENLAGMNKINTLSIANGEVAARSFKDATLKSLSLTNISDYRESAFENLKMVDEEGNPLADYELNLGGGTNIALWKYAFKGSNITSVTLTGIRGIITEAFAGSSLKKVSLNGKKADGGSLVIDPNIFKGCAQLEEAELINVDLIKDGATAKEILTGSPIKTLTLDKVKFLENEFKGLPIEKLVAKNIEDMPDNAFKSNATIKTVDLTGSVVSDDAFNGCTALTAVTNLSSKEIGTNAFYGCGELASVALLDGVETIKYAAFAGTNLSKITLPKTVNKICSSAFAVKEGAFIEEITVLNDKNVITLDDDDVSTFKQITVNLADPKTLATTGTVTFVGKEEIVYNDNNNEINRIITPTVLNVPANVLEGYKTAKNSDNDAVWQWQNFFTCPTSMNNQQALVWNHMEGTSKKNGTDYSNKTETEVSKLTFERELSGDGWYDWYEPFDVTVGELEAAGVEVAQIYSVMPTYTEDGRVGDREENLLCYIVTDDDRTIRHNTPYMIRKNEKYNGKLSLEFTAGESNAVAIYKNGTLVCYNIVGGSDKKVKLYEAKEDALTATSLRSEYKFKGVYHYDRYLPDEANKIERYGFKPGGGLTVLGRDKDGNVAAQGTGIYGQRWYLEIRDASMYGDTYNNVNKSEAAPRINIIATYEQQGESTGISVIENTVAKNLKGIYTVDGKKVQSLENMPAGVYVVNGKAVYKK